MENNENMSFVDAYSKKLLQDIKSMVKQNRINLEEDKEKKVDPKMVEIIENLCTLKKDNTNDINSIYKLMPTDNKNESDRILSTLVLYYTALYEDNLPLLNRLLEEEFSFGNKPYDLKAFALVKEISSEFDEDEYIRLLKKQSNVFKDFYFSLNRDDLSSEKRLIKRFKNILEEDEDVALDDNGYQKNAYIRNLLTKQSIQLFGENIILNSSRGQKKHIISCAKSIMDWKDVNVMRLINLMKNNDYEAKRFLSLSDVLFDNLSDDELIRAEEFESFLDFDDFDDHIIDYDRIKRKINGEELLSDKNNLFGKILRKFKKINQ